MKPHKEESSEEIISVTLAMLCLGFLLGMMLGVSI